MSFIEHSDKFSEKMAEAIDKGFFSEDIFTTMRFSRLHPEEQFSNVMAFGNARSWLYTGIMQWERMADALQKLKDAGFDREKIQPPEAKRLVPENANYNPVQVDEILVTWKEYKQDEVPFSPTNVVWVLNKGWRYNRNLMHWAHAWEPIHRALLNGRFAVDDRTFKALVDLGKNQYQRESQTDIGEPEKRGRSLRHPLGQK